MAGVVASAVAGAIIPAATAFLIGLLRRSNARARPKSQSADAGAIVPERASATAIVLFGVLLIALGILAIVGGLVLLGAPAVFFGAIFAGFMAPSLTDAHVVRWTAEGVEGPSKTFGPTLGIERVMIHWRDIKRTGKTKTAYWYVEDDDDHRVYWSYLHKGYGAFVQALSEHCPSLTMPEDIA